MNTRRRLLLGLLSSLVLAPTCWAQPAVPAAPAAPAAPANLWSFLLPNADQKRACKACFCNSPIGQMLSGAAGPISTFSGGLIANRCLANSIANDLLTKSPTSAEGAAAAIMKDEAEAKARRAAVRYLGTVDCNYWPEATEALVNSLRKDPNECVRFEAALSLGRGCCCNPKTIKALEMCVTGSRDDGAPPEHSDRVRAAATDALARRPSLPAAPGKTDKDGIKKAEATPVNPLQREQIAATARGLLVSLQSSNGSALSQRSVSLAAIFNHAVNPPTIVQAPAALDGAQGACHGRHAHRAASVPAPPIIVYPPQVINMVPPRVEFGLPAPVPVPTVPTVDPPRDASRHGTPESAQPRRFNHATHGRERESRPQTG